ncbi:MAG: hypothetical protein ACLT0O_03920 [Sutterella wadsworthensis]
MADELKGALEVLSRTESSIEARLVLSEGMSVFDGHFPCLAILPGVVQLNLVETLAAEWAGRPLRIASIPQMKFTVPLRPGDALLVKLAFKPAEDGLGASFSLERRRTARPCPQAADALRSFSGDGRRHVRLSSRRHHSEPQPRAHPRGRA